ncbi:geranylgeranyl pyrophosphate synthetase [Stachybotrys elegans]|uniref:Geranylgeranyl pyrophosphate synthetase n=1 Tax=Stachybotrys elegans TaxID=80388 RepID=A0A8K0SJA0_9HYPO|nr:geranylgeranyl pyrophosphate synthetase [Stachybotrys elegans]
MDTTRITSKNQEAAPLSLSNSEEKLSPAQSKPPAFDATRFEHADLDFSPDKTWDDSKEFAVKAPYSYLESAPGKDFRMALINAFNAWLGVSEEKVDIIVHSVSMLHTASLLIDDIQDESLLRRGLPVAHTIFGLAQTINSANYIYFQAACELQKLRSRRAIDIFNEELVQLHRGQGMELMWRETLTCPSEDDYLEMISNKTAGLFRLAVRLLQEESDVEPKADGFVSLAQLLGLIYQIVDDYRNMTDEKYIEQKGFYEDLTEGKFSFPVVHSIHTDRADTRLLSILRSKTTDDNIKRHAIDHMQKKGSLEYTRKVIAILTERARALATRLDAGTGKAKAFLAILDKASAIGA